MAIRNRELYARTSLTQAFNGATTNDHYGTIFVRVEGLTDDRNQLQAAITEAVATRMTHPDLGILIREATADWIPSQSKADRAAGVLLQYHALPKTNGGTQPITAGNIGDYEKIANVTIAPYVLNSWRTATDEIFIPADDSTEVVLKGNPNTKGRDGGPILQVLPVPARIILPELTIRIPVFTDNSLVPWATSMVGHLNANIYKIADYSFPVKTLRFDGVSMNAYYNGTDWNFISEVTFTAHPLAPFWLGVVGIDTLSPTVFKAKGVEDYTTATFTAPPL